MSDNDDFFSRYVNPQGTNPRESGPASPDVEAESPSRGSDDEETVVVERAETGKSAEPTEAGRRAAAAGAGDLINGTAGGGKTTTDSTTPLRPGAPAGRPPAPDAYGWGPGGSKHGYDARPAEPGPPPAPPRGAVPPRRDARDSAAPARSTQRPWRPEGPMRDRPAPAGPTTGPNAVPPPPSVFPWQQQAGGQQAPGEQQPAPPTQVFNPQTPPRPPGVRDPESWRQSGPAASQPGPRDAEFERPAGYQPEKPPPGIPHHPAPARHGGASVGPMRAQIRQADLVRPYKPEPETGWRKVFRRLTRINLGPSPSERAWKDLERRIGVNLRGTYLIAVMQQKGGVSKTTATVGIGAALARYRHDKVVAVDGNPASGNLTKRIDESSTGTWRGLTTDDNLHAYSDFRFHLGNDSSSGLEVLAGDPGDDVITGEKLTEAWRRLQRQYPVGIIDCGTQLRDDVTAAVLAMADAVVVVSTTRLDGAQGAEETLNWLIEHGYPHLVRSAVMVISNVSRVEASAAVRDLHEDFERVVRAVHDVPYDSHLHDAGAINFDRLNPATRRAYIEVAASLVDGFAGAADRDPGALGQPGSGERR